MTIYELFNKNNIREYILGNTKRSIYIDGKKLVLSNKQGSYPCMTISSLLGMLNVRPQLGLETVTIGGTNETTS